MTDALLEGFKKYNEEHGDLTRQLAREGQTPEYFIISCIDSRSNPGTIFRPQPGTFMAHKAMGAIVRPYKKGTALAAALQFSLVHMKIRKLVLLGHTSCGAIKALVDKIDDPEIFSFVDVAQGALAKAKARVGENAPYEKLLRETEQQIVLESIENLKSYPSVQTALKDGLVIAPWMFDMETGTLMEYKAASQKFEAITQNEKKAHQCAHC